jgi:type 1 fimbriae regulatory protein FimB
MSELSALTQNEIHSIIELAKTESARNAAMVALSFRHGMRASEITGLLMSDVNLKHNTITVKRLKGSNKTIQELSPEEVSLLTAWLSERNDESEFVFTSRNGGRMDRKTWYRVFQSLAERTGLSPEKQHPHCLKHSLAHHLLAHNVPLNVIQRALGHKNLSSTGRYLECGDATANKAMAAAFAA